MFETWYLAQRLEQNRDQLPFRPGDLPAGHAVASSFGSKLSLRDDGRFLQ
jgi:hypothetical protein